MGTFTYVDRISRRQLSYGAGKAIEVVRSRKAFRIVGPKAMAESTLKALDQTIGQIRTKRVSLTSALKARLTADVIEELGRIANCLVELDEVQHEVSEHQIPILSCL